MPQEEGEHVSQESLCAKSLFSINWHRNELDNVDIIILVLLLRAGNPDF